MLLKNTFETIPFTEDIELRLSSFYKQFRPFGCTYMYYTVNDPNRGRIRFSTNTDWMKSYLEDGLTHVDPVKRICEQKKRGLSLHHEPKINRSLYQPSENTTFPSRIVNNTWRSGFITTKSASLPTAILPLRVSI